MPHPNRPRPLIPWDSHQPIPVTTLVDGVPVTGKIVFLSATDMAVTILSPVSGFGTSLHVPCFAAGYRQNHLATDSGITERGTSKAHDLLAELFLFVQGGPSGWGIYKVEADESWTDLYPVLQR